MNLPLENRANIAVIGGGPAGSFFSFFALKFARLIGKEINITIFEPKDFKREGPAGCNKCGGVISELLVQKLAVEGINLPDSIVRKGINSYILHTRCGSVYISTPTLEKTIATVYRGGGPKGSFDREKESFDGFLLDLAVSAGAEHKAIRIDRIEYKDNRPILFSNNEKIIEPELVVGAIGINSHNIKMFEGINFGYSMPKLKTALIAEMSMDEDKIKEYFGNSIHIFLIPNKSIKFAAMIPKGHYITICIIGMDSRGGVLNEFLYSEVIGRIIPKSVDYKIECRCLPKLNVGAPKLPFTDRLVICGDAGSTRLYKDGIGSAYMTGKAAAKTAIFYGVGKKDFEKEYYPIYKNIIIDNYYGRYLYGIIEAYKRSIILTKGMINTIRKEQQDKKSQKILSSIIWDLFTGNEKYRNIFPNALSLRMHLYLWKEFTKILIKGGKDE